jgi:hypothetical protein
MRFILLISVALLSSCGADGPPERPVQSGISLTGEARVGVAYN